MRWQHCPSPQACVACCVAAHGTPSSVSCTQAGGKGAEGSSTLVCVSWARVCWGEGVRTGWVWERPADPSLAGPLAMVFPAQGHAGPTTNRISVWARPATGASCGVLSLVVLS